MVGKPGRSGGPRKPAELRRLEGNRGHRKIRNEPKAQGRPVAPDFYNEEQRKLWDVALAFAPQGILAACDGPMLEVFVASWWTLREARRGINQLGLMVRGSEGQPIRHPLLSVARGAAADLSAAASQLGLSPLARTRLIEKDDGEFDPLALLLGLDDPNSGPVRAN